MNAAELTVRFTSDLTSLQRGFAQATRSTEAFSQRLITLGTTLTASLTLPLAGVAVSAFNAGVRLDAMRASLTAVMGSSLAAERELGKLRETARLPGLGFEQAVRGSTALQTVGFSAKLAREALAGFGNAVATTGGSTPELERVITQLSQMAAAGKVLQQDLRPIIQTAPAVGQALIKAFGTINPEQIEKLGLSTEQFMTRFVKAVNELPHTTGGAVTALENLREGWGDLMRSLSTNVMPAAIELITRVTKKLEEWAAAFGALTPAQQRHRLEMIAFVAVLGPALTVVGSVASALRGLAAAFALQTIAQATAAWFALVPAITSAADAFVLLRFAVIGVTTSLGPLGIAAAVLGAVAFAFFKAGESARQAAAQAAIAAQTFRASLATMDQATLGAGVAHRTQALPIIQAEINRTNTLLTQARTALAQTERARSAAAGGRGAPASGGVDRAAASVSRLTNRLSALNEQYRRNRDELRLMGEQFNKNLPQADDINRFVPSAGGDGGKSLAGLVDRVGDAVRHLQNLMQFRGVIQEDDLTEPFQAQLRLVDDLGNRVDTLSDQLAKLGSRAPREAFSWLERLQDLLASQTEQLRRQAQAWNDLWAARMQGNLRISTIANQPATFNTGAARGIDDSLGIASAGLGRMFGDLGARASFASQALAYLREGTLQAGRVLGSLVANTAGRGGEFAGNIAQITQSLQRGGASFAAAAPQALALAAALEVANGLFSALQPALQALTLPLRIFGEILSLLVIPVLRILFPIFKVVAIVGSYLAETIAKVVSFILNAIGGFVRAIGKFINAIVPFANPGNPLVKAGEAMQKTAANFGSAAAEMAKKRKELEHLSFDDALKKTTDGMNRLAESLTNVPPLFDLALRRIQASRGTTSAPSSLPSPVPPSVPGTAGGGGRQLVFNFEKGAIQGTGDPHDAARHMVALVARAMGVSSDPEIRNLALAFRQVAI